MSSGDLSSAIAMPVRVQRKRIKGWRMPPNTVYVGRPTKWGNPFTAGAALDSGYANESTGRIFIVECFRDWLGPSRSGRDWWSGPEADRRRKFIAENVRALQGKNLACWCALDQPCHADVLLEIANAPARSAPKAEGGE